jgi:hypothetical protein
MAQNLDDEQLGFGIGSKPTPVNFGKPAPQVHSRIEILPTREAGFGLP